jgi:geranylgeranyl diphosphate synthase type II
LASAVRGKKPDSLYDPIRYAIRTGGKRMRGILTLCACEAAGGTARQALGAAAAIELLHNFTLVHDDIMDHASLRRGKKTIHIKWDTNTAILSGDQMIACAYRLLYDGDGAQERLTAASRAFTNAFLEVCEGQGYDKDFETRRAVSLNDYMMMIGKKTAAVISAAAETGAILGSGAGAGAASHTRALRNYGFHLGLAFQIMDDLLDASGTETEFGKRIGSDIIEGKKTFLLLTARARAKGADRALIESVLQHRKLNAKAVSRVQELYLRCGVLDEAREAILRHTKRALAELTALNPGPARDALAAMAEQSARRTS